MPVDIKNIKMSELSGLIEELLEKDNMVRVTVTGNSMYPFLRHGADSVLIKKRAGRPLRGDIVLVKKADGRFVLHRIIGIKDNGFFIMGDSQDRPEGPLDMGRIAAVVVKVYRKGREISCSSLSWRMLSWMWSAAVPIRKIIIRAYLAAGRIRSRIRKKMHPGEAGH
jgi:signal peptidase I